MLQSTSNLRQSVSIDRHGPPPKYAATDLVPPVANMFSKKM
jgi:hypothetical protein